MLKIIALAGPQTVSSLAKTNRYWRKVMEDEETWRALCEELYKWKPSDDIHSSWKHHYLSHPCIPVDFYSVDSALEILYPSQDKRSHHKVVSAIHFLFRPGVYNIKRTILIDNAQGVIPVTFEKMSIQPAEEGEVLLNYNGLKSNSPLFRLEKGVLELIEVRVSHQSSGIDLWRGNAAIHVEGKKGIVLFFAVRCAITSKSGRGIVVSNRGMLELEHCNIHSCAATGIYVSGANCTADITSTDIVGNGNGNGGLARGHSGICIESGGVYISDSNISHNSASGISAITADEYGLSISDSDVIGNGAMPLDLPTGGRHAVSISMAFYERNGNHLGDSGLARPRSALSNT